MEQKWIEIINQWENSKLPRSQFCKIHKFSDSKMFYYIKKYRPDLIKPAPVVIRKNSESIPSFVSVIQKKQSMSIDPVWLAKFLRQIHDN